MYVLAEMKDVVHVKPWLFDKDLRIVIEDELNKKFANKVIYQLGLCITLFDILNIEKSYIFPGDGSSHTRVTFRYVIFRPFIDEVLTGKVKSCSKEGLHVTMSFFDDIFIPVNNLQEPSKFDEKEQLFVWEYGGESDQPKAQLFIDMGEEIRFRVVDEAFIDTTPTGPPSRRTPESYQNNETKSPYSIVATINEPGLGLLSWWLPSS